MMDMYNSSISNHKINNKCNKYIYRKMENCFSKRRMNKGSYYLEFYIMPLIVLLIGNLLMITYKIYLVIHN